MRSAGFQLLAMIPAKSLSEHTRAVAKGPHLEFAENQHAMEGGRRRDGLTTPDRSANLSERGGAVEGRVAIPLGCLQALRLFRTLGSADQRVRAEKAQRDRELNR